MVEINLTSNDGILGVSGKDHPLPIYMKYGVPVSLSTDDEGISRIELTHEFARAAETYDLSYSDLKRMVRTSLEHSFLPGDSLWREPDAFTRTSAACSGDSLGADKPSDACAAFLRTSKSGTAMGTRAAISKIRGRLLSIGSGCRARRRYAPLCSDCKAVELRGNHSR